MKHALILLTLIIYAMTLSSCSVVMAVKGTEEADLSVLRRGTPRPVVVAELGEPKHVGGNIDIYEACKGDKSSLGRALAHGAMDVLTSGLWEVIGTPIEAASELGKDCYRFTIVYDENEEIEEIR